MAVERDNPNGGFNFLVNLGAAQTTPAAAGFAEVFGLGMAVDVVEYRNGNDKVNATRKLPGLTRTPQVRLCRGIVGDLSLFDWLQSVAKGSQDYRDITIELLSEDQSQTVFTWSLTQAIPVSYSTPSLAAGKSALAIEELVLACQSIAVS